MLRPNQRATVRSIPGFALQVSLAAFAVCLVLTSCFRPARPAESEYPPWTPGSPPKLLDTRHREARRPQRVGQRPSDDARIARRLPRNRRSLLRFAYVKPNHTLVVYDGGREDPTVLARIAFHRSGTSFPAATLTTIQVSIPSGPLATRYPKNARRTFWTAIRLS
jgi:hypothetical protein